MDCKYFFTDSAAEDLDNTLSYIRAELDNPTASDSFLDELEKNN